ncbi:MULTISPECIES: carbohydrate ABC transporter permease [unclassified Saccharopolyspora]|uniref:carbohydrate ABC transporter permease n=1 Tax=unclassified Saccharopolyspora TaxID=2646250 RepID=UPI001CD25015|nr:MULTISPECIES: sugar ABC transporter permease [unclassified Saccharopolyspora]MCA1185359.1 sugar ABC transporter permease [Saccharopolyspora sp. 6T]MCA1194232.1 sugar ABC transporter permease [Saccharopolyspora sp. 6V]MCA1224697.1 sugar ABC transporter permease [Saccharopolyspora sp. 6M]MCA1279376.1 sugar ABC transporter permease [Saccharopolyspora sp. 7B]
MSARTRRDARDFWLFVGPLLLGLVVFAYVPIGWSLYLSFFDARNTVTPEVFVGVDNYAAMLGNEAFLASLGTFTAFAAGIVPLTYAAALALALAVDRLPVAKAFFRSVFFLPFACSYVVAALIWKTSLFPGVSSGLVNSALGAFGVEPVAWTGTADPPLYWIVLITARLWLQLGFYMLLFIAALQRIPRHLYEAAWLDGAKPGWQVFRHITLPQLRGTSVAVLLLLLIGAFQAFDEFYNILGDARGYPPYGRPPLVYLYYTALGSGGQDLGRGSAGAVILSALIAVVTLVQGKVFGFGTGRQR